MSDMARQVRVFAVQAWKPEFKSPGHMGKLFRITCVHWREGTRMQEFLGPAGHQPSTRFRDRPCLDQ